VQTAVRSETHDRANRGGARQTFLAGFRYDPFVQQLAVVTVALTDENAKQVAFFG